MKTKTLLATALVALFAAGVQAQPVMKDGALTDTAGRTVYTFDKDEANKSNCAGACLANWPVYVAPAGAAAKGVYGVIDSAGTRQWTVKGKPLYYFVGDAKAGDRNGDGKAGVWHLVK